jgi:hypothetical protein
MSAAVTGVLPTAMARSSADPSEDSGEYSCLTALRIHGIMCFARAEDGFCGGN